MGGPEPSGVQGADGGGGAPTRCPSVLIKPRVPTFASALLTLSPERHLYFRLLLFLEPCRKVSSSVGRGEGRGRAEGGSNNSLTEKQGVLWEISVLAATAAAALLRLRNGCLETVHCRNDNSLLCKSNNTSSSSSFPTI